MKRLEFDVHEVSDGWHCTQTDRTYKTVSKAKRAIDRRTAKLAEENEWALCAAFVTWHTMTDVGARIVMSVTQ